MPIETWGEAEVELFEIREMIQWENRKHRLSGLRALHARD
jgi:hypothetical protein